MPDIAFDQWQLMYEQYFQDTFGSPRLCLEKGEGCYLWDSEGNKYLDMLAGIAVNALGYAHPAIVHAIEKQAEKLTHVSNYFTTPAQISLGRTLTRIFENSGYSYVKSFLCNSGTEANEAALKLARLFKPGGIILALDHSFHGRTMGALAATGKETIREPFEPLPAGVEFCAATREDLQRACARLGDRLGAIICEPIQGEAGVIPLEAGFLSDARDYADRAGALLIIDEVQTGMGRTGQWLASASGVDPVKADVITLAKGLGAGVPIGAMVVCSPQADVFSPGLHGTTFGGNPLACAVSNAGLGEIEKLLPHVRSVSSALIEGLTSRGYRVRGRGLLLGVEVENAPHIVSQLLKKGVIANAPRENTVRLAPPLIITHEQVEEFLHVWDHLGEEKERGLHV